MKVAVITGSRADWNGLGMVAKCLRKEHHIAIDVIAIGQHYANQESLSVIIDDGFDPKLYRTNFQEDMAFGSASAAIAVAGALDSHLPDMALVLGDRFEILGAATAASLRGIPLAHIGGGDITEGSVDNKLRYAITALADLHFTTNLESYQRLDNAETPGGIYNLGTPALDRIAQTPITDRFVLFKRLGLRESKRNVLVAFHAATAEPDPTAGCAAMLDALNGLPHTSFVIVGTNSDTGSQRITDLLSLFAASNSTRCILRDNLPPEDFYGCLQHFDCMIGNSSAGLVETAGFGIPVVNIGNRQKGRPEPANVFSCIANAEAIGMTTQIAMAGRCVGVSNPYGDGHSAPRIAKAMVNYLGET